MRRSARWFCAVILILGCTGTAAGRQPRPVWSALTVHASGAPAPVRTRRSIPGYAKRNPAKAFLLSALFPGAGQFYAGRKKGILYSIVEIGGWTSYFLLDRAGDRRTRRMKAFADAHWDLSRCLPECTDGSGPEILDPFGTQQYYEQIGKWDQFQSGWDDYTPGSNAALSPNRAIHVSMRRHMNQPFRWASRTAGVLLFNHVISAIHAALIVRNDNRDAQQAGRESRLHFHLEGLDARGTGPSATFSFTL